MDTHSVLLRHIYGENIVACMVSIAKPLEENDVYHISLLSSVGRSDYPNYNEFETNWPQCAYLLLLMSRNSFLFLCLIVIYG